MPQIPKPQPVATPSKGTLRVEVRHSEGTHRTATVWIILTRGAVSYSLVNGDMTEADLALLLPYLRKSLPVVEQEHTLLLVDGVSSPAALELVEETRRRMPVQVGKSVGR